MTNKNQSNESMSTILKESGWIESSVGQYRSNGQLKDKEGYRLFIRRRNLRSFIDDFSKKSSNDNSPNPCGIRVCDTGSNDTMGIPKLDLTPTMTKDKDVDKSLPSLSSFSNYSSLVAIRKDKPCILIGFDSEWENMGYGRKMLSWQFALVEGNDLVEYVFLQENDKILSFLDALGCILDHLEIIQPIDLRTIRRFKYCDEWVDGKPLEKVTEYLKVAQEYSKYVYRKDIGFTDELIRDMPDKDLKSSERDWSWFNTFHDFSLVKNTDICIVCHTGKVDLSALQYDNDNFWKGLTEVQGGLVTLNPMKYAPRSLRNVNNTYVYPILLSVADTMCHAPAGKKKLKDLGEAIGVEKIDIDISRKEHMQGLLEDNLKLFFEYASTDSVITVLYVSAMYGYNNALPVTITSATASVMKELMMDYLGCYSTAEFNRVYRGLETVKHGMLKRENRPGFVEATNLEPISNAADVIQSYTSYAYHGGYNICTEVGYFPYDTFDYDLQNAYPTAMCLVPDINWEQPIKNEIIRRELTLEDFMDGNGENPLTPFVGYVQFEFPATCKYPCIPISVDGIPLYPLTSEGLNGVYVAGPFVWLALKQGARVYCDRGYFLNIIYLDDCCEESRSLADAVKQLVVDRNKAKADKGKGSLEELILKTMVNSGYGKNAQNVIEKSAWSARNGLMEDLGCSAITNPFSAMMITSIVQVELIAAQNQIEALGYMSCSVTTDGFISNCPEEILKGLDLYGLRKYMESARIFLTDGDPELWEIKHQQSDLVNFTTRGNVSLSSKGVCAHNSAKSGHESDSYEDRYWLMTQVLSRTGTVDYTENEWTTFKELAQGKPLVVKPVTRHIRMDFDMKRKPLKDSFVTDIVVIEGVEYEIAHFDTIPFKTVEEFRLYRSKKNLTEVLRTEMDWSIFWKKLEFSNLNVKPRDSEWSILLSCIMGYRIGLWDIPALNGKSVQEKCEWINNHNTSYKIFKESDWKNARKPDRVVNMLPKEFLIEKLEELQNDVEQDIDMEIVM